MKRTLLLLCSALTIYASELHEVLQALEHNTLLEAKSYESKAKSELSLAAKGRDLPVADLTFDTAWLKTQPTITLELPTMPKMKVPMGKKRTFTFEAGISYPLFTGFAITNLIRKARYEAMAAKLRQRDLKRQLALKAVELYGGLYSVDHEIAALQAAVDALKLSYKKARGLYAQGLIPKSDLYNIEAKLYEIEANIEDAKAKRESLQNGFRYLVGFAPKKAKLESFELPKRLDYRSRADIVALQKELMATRSEIGLAKSKFYPSVALKAAFRRFGDTLALDGDGVRNADESYIGAHLAYNLYHGGSDEHTYEAAKAAFMAKKSFLRDYERRVRTDIDNAKNELHALRKRLAWAKKQLEAKREYAKLVQGRYNNQLASADELSRAIADEAASRALLESIRSQIFVQKCKILLMHSYTTFERIAKRL